MNRLYVYTLAMLALLSIQGCLYKNQVLSIQETETTRPGYAVEWPADASRNPEHYHTTSVEGYMITTVPRVESVYTLPLEPYPMPPIVYMDDQETE
jgi:hypothetical protein